MTRLEDRQFKQLPITKVLEYASCPKWSLDKAHAIYELACRSLENPALLPDAWRCIGAEITFATRQGTPLGQPAAALLLESGVKGVEETLVESMRDWTEQQQADFFFGLFPKNERRSVVNRLRTGYSFVPKVRIDEQGDVCFDG
jgi:hypothetical protein